MKNVPITVLAAALLLPSVSGAAPRAPRETNQAAVEAAGRAVDAQREKLGLRSDDVPVVADVAVSKGLMGTIARVHYARQEHAGVPVEGTEIEAIVELVAGAAPKVHGVGGRWYHEFSGDGKAGLSLDAARKGLVGQTLGYTNFIGQPEYMPVTADMVASTGELVWLPASADGPCRLAWKVRVGSGLAWDVYADAASGAMLASSPLFRS